MRRGHLPSFYQHGAVEMLLECLPSSAVIISSGVVEQASEGIVYLLIFFMIEGRWVGVPRSSEYSRWHSIGISFLVGKAGIVDHILFEIFFII